MYLSQQQSIQQCLNGAQTDEPSVRHRHQDLLNSAQFLRDLGATDHFCVYFAGVDTVKQQIFLGHHKKADLWLFHGGHLNPDETVEKCLYREIGEEWGIPEATIRVLPYRRLTVTPIENTRQPLCKNHYDLWHFIDLRSESCSFDATRITAEFHRVSWMTVTAARAVVQDPNSLATITWIETTLFSE